MTDLWAALCLVLVIEGILPFVNPKAWKETVSSIAGMDDRTLRIMGGAAMAIGVLLLYLVRGT